MPKRQTNLRETLQKCKDFGFNEEITRETLWNTAYWIGRDRWYWGPRWFVSVTGWVNTQIGKLKSLFAE